jgi:predicted NAD-dependent protein-ADP-ribosyltransferase YbiA (DUF1768 family)
MEKYLQNPKAREVLMATGTTKLGEASKSKIWGIGMDLTDSNVFNVDVWSNNVFGETLIRVRDTIKNK